MSSRLLRDAIQEILREAKSAKKQTRRFAESVLLPKHSEHTDLSRFSLLELLEMSSDDDFANLMIEKRAMRTVISEGAKTIDDLGPDMYIQIKDLGSMYKIVLRQLDRKYNLDYSIGYVNIEQEVDARNPCFNAWYIVHSSTRSHGRAGGGEGAGFGPLLYDIAIELTGKDGLMADREQVSPDAYSIWDYYLNNRQSEFDFRQLDLSRSILDDPNMSRGLEPDTQITPDYHEDDCQSISVVDWSRSKDGQWPDVAVNFVIRRRGGATPTLDRLRRENKLVEA